MAARVTPAHLPPQRPCLCYAYENATGSQRIVVGEHFFERLIRERWCVKVFVERDGARRIHVCRV